MPTDLPPPQPPSVPRLTDLPPPADPPPTRPLPDLPVEPTPPPTPGDPPRTAPTDVGEETARLAADAAAHGVDLAAALDVAHALEHTLPTPDALRAVDRRIASGLSLDETRRVLLDEDPVLRGH
jgi:hypothetical protein